MRLISLIRVSVSTAKVDRSLGCYQGLGLRGRGETNARHLPATIVLPEVSLRWGRARASAEQFAELFEYPGPSRHRLSQATRDPAAFTSPWRSTTSLPCMSG